MAGDGGINPDKTSLPENPSPTRKNLFKEVISKAALKTNIKQLFKRNSVDTPPKAELIGDNTDKDFYDPIQLSPLSKEQLDNINQDSSNTEVNGDFLLTLSELEGDYMHPETRNKALREVKRVANNKIANINFDIEENADGITDSEINALVKLVETYTPNYPIREQLDREIQEKQKAAEFLAPGNFLAHGAYSQDIPAILQSGGMRSTWSRINGGFLSAEDEVPRWKKDFKTQPHAGGIFFSPWHLNYYAGHYSDDTRGGTDVAIIFPAEEVAKMAKAIEVRGNQQHAEVAVTGSQRVYESGIFNGAVDVSDDDLVLPLDQAYVVAFGPQSNSVIQTFQENGYSKEWIADHLKVYSEARLTKGNGGLENLGYINAIADRKKEISNWLQSKHSPLMEKMRLVRRLVHPNTENEFPGKVYSAK